MIFILPAKQAKSGISVLLRRDGNPFRREMFIPLATSFTALILLKEHLESERRLEGPNAICEVASAHRFPHPHHVSTNISQSHDSKICATIRKLRNIMIKFSKPFVDILKLATAFAHWVNRNQGNETFWYPEKWTFYQINYSFVRFWYFCAQ